MAAPLAEKSKATIIRSNMSRGNVVVYRLLCHVTKQSRSDAAAYVPAMALATTK